MSRSRRSGNYSMVMGVMLPIFIGFAALSTDTSWMEMARSQAQDVADSAAHAALVELRRSGSRSNAKAVAQYLVKKNAVGEGHSDLATIRFGGWRRGDFDIDESASRPNAIAVTVSRDGDNSLPLYFAKIWDRDSVELESSAVSAARSLHVVLVMDITGSFRFDIHYARDGAVAFAEVLHDTAGEDDRLGMVTFFYRYAHIWTEMTAIHDVSAYNPLYEQWEELTWCNSDIDWDGPSWPPRPWKDWGGSGWHNVAPQMPGCWGDEGGTDHGIGMKQGIDLLLEQDDPFAYRAMIVLTDGQPSAFSGFARRRPEDTGETWRYTFNEKYSRSTSEMKADAYAEADRADDNDINTWTISYGGYGQAEFMAKLVTGDGAAYTTTNAADIEPIFVEIATQMPMLLVK